MEAKTCAGCGASSAGVFVCLHCGLATHPLTDVVEQQRALDELHGRLAAPDVPAGLLLNAFLPEDPRVLIDAGLRLLPVLENAAGQSGAAGRLRAVIIKLRLIPGDPTVISAAREFEHALAKYETSDRRMGIALTVILLAVIGGAIAIGQCACQ